MRTTIQLEDTLFRQVKAQAAREGLPLKALIEEGLRLLLSRRRQVLAGDKPFVALPVSTCSGGGRPGLDLSDNRALEDLLSDD